MSRWFRVYDTLVDDPKVQRLGSDLYKALINLWCLASQNGGALPCIADIAYKLRLKPDRVTAIIEELRRCGLLDDDETGIAPHNWNARQYKSDVSTERVKRFRKRHETVSETPPEQSRAETESKTEPEKKKEARATRGASLPDGWLPSPEDLNYGATLGLSGDEIAAATEDLRLWAKANSNRSIGRKADWSSTFKAWMRRNRGKTHGQTENGIIAAQRKLIAGSVEFGPRPSLIRSAESSNPVRLLPEGRCERPGDLHGVDHGDSGGVPRGGDPARHGPEDGDSAKN